VGAFSKNHLDLGIKTCLIGGLTSNIDIDRVKSRPTYTPITTALPCATADGDSR
jgi:hypothetical protein